MAVGKAMVSKTPGINGNGLKIIAIVSMLIDHIGASLIEIGFLHSDDARQLEAILKTPMGMRMYWVDFVLRTIGRIAFPIFCFLLVEGFLHTRNVKKYAGRMFAFALISEIPYDLNFFNRFLDFKQQNVYFTLLIGLLVIWGLKRWRNPVVSLIIVACGCGLAEVLKTDYSAYGVAMIVLIYLLHSTKKPMYCMAGLFAAYESYSQLGAAALAFLPISQYNGERGTWNLKYLFYFFYPAHILLLWLIRILW